jgi:protein required for attachment to host cells
MAKQKWVVVANSAMARLFQLKGMELIEMPALVHPEARMREQDLVADGPGATYGSSAMSVARYATGQKTPPKKVEDIQFAREVAKALELARSRGEIEKIYLAASPSFLGLIRQELPEETLKIIESSISKDITHLKREEIRTYFPIGL